MSLLLLLLLLRCFIARKLDVFLIIFFAELRNDTRGTRKPVLFAAEVFGNDDADADVVLVVLLVLLDDDEEEVREEEDDVVGNFEDRLMIMNILLLTSNIYIYMF